MGERARRAARRVAAYRRRQRVSRLPADRAGGDDAGRLARAADRRSRSARLVFVVGPPVDWPAPMPDGGRFARARPPLGAFGPALGARCATRGGAALFIDYGRRRVGPGDTLQAMRGHARRSPGEPRRGRPHRPRRFSRPSSPAPAGPERAVAPLETPERRSSRASACASGPTALRRAQPDRAALDPPPSWRG